MTKNTGQFKKGQSGNPKGKPPGTRHKATMAALSLLEGEAEALSRKAVELALEGDTTALRLCLERVAPPLKEQPLAGIDFPEINTPGEMLEAINKIGHLLASGEILPHQADALCRLLEQSRKHYEAVELEERIDALEQDMAKSRGKRQ